MFASYIVGAARTPRGRGKRNKGALAGIHPQELFAQTLTTLQDRVGFEPREVDDVIAGCVSQVGEQGANVARNAVLAAGWPYEVSAVSLNRFCASGLQAIHFGAMGVASGAMDLVIAGGVESMSRVPMGSDASGQDGNNLHLRERLFQIPQGISAGAGAVGLASEPYVRQKEIKPRARLRAMATIGSEPMIMLTAPALASEKALRLAGMKPRDIDLWEINEAFASVVLQTIRALG